MIQPLDRLERTVVVQSKTKEDDVEKGKDVHKQEKLLESGVVNRKIEAQFAKGLTEDEGIGNHWEVHVVGKFLLEPHAEGGGSTVVSADHQHPFVGAHWSPHREMKRVEGCWIQ